MLLDEFMPVYDVSDAVATVGITESMLIIIYSIAMGLGMGAAAIVARRTGEGDADGASRAAVQAILLGIVVALPIGVGGVIYARKRPNPWPGTFGYHEVFHAMTIVAAICHYIAVYFAMYNSPFV